MGFGSQTPRAGIGSIDNDECEQFGLDPSIAPGLARPIGWRVRKPDGTGAWDKTGLLDTDWTPVGGGGGGVTSVVGVAPIQVNTVAGVATVSDLAPPAVADWIIDRMRVYAVDLVNGNDAHAGFADMAGTSAGAYATACAAAGAVAKKTIAGLAAIFPRSGAGRLVEIVIAAGDYSAGAGIETVLDGVGGYASNCPVVRGTITDATAGSVAFAGTAADVAMAGCVRVPGLNNAGYNPIAGSNAHLLVCQKVGGAAPGFGAEPAVPTGWRQRFDSATATVALRNAAREVGRVSGTDTLSLQTDLPAVPANTDVFYAEQAGVILPAFATPSVLSAPPNGVNGIQWSGLRTAGLWSFGDIRIRFSQCGAGSLVGNTSFLSMSQNLTHPILGTVVVGGGLRCETTATINAGALVAAGLVTVTDLTIGQNTSPTRVQWGAGCASRRIFAANVLGNNSPDETDSLPNFGTPNAVSIGVPRIFGGVAGDALTIDGCPARVGGINFVLIQGSCFKPRGKADLFLTGPFTAFNVDNYGLDLRAASGATIQVNGTGNMPSGTLGDILAGGGSNTLGPNIDWSRLTLIDIWDTNDNHLVDFTAGGNYVGTTDASVCRGQLGNPAPDANVALGIVRYGSGGPLFVPAKADSIAHATGIAGILYSNFNSAFCLLGGLSGFRVLQFDAAPVTGAMAYLSAATAAMASTTVPPLSFTAAKLRLGTVVQVLGGDRAIVCMATDLTPVLADGLP